jgi:hypothetical protein
MCNIGVASLIFFFLVSSELGARDPFDRGTPVATSSDQDVETFGSSGFN